MPVITIDRYTSQNKHQFSQLYRQIQPDLTLRHGFPPASKTWLIWQDGVLVGYTAVSPLPGLQTIYELDGGIIPAQRRQGLGSQLLPHVIAQLQQQITEPIQLSYCLTDLNDPAAHFLRHHAFFTEHEELQLAISYEQLAISYEPLAMSNSPFSILHFPFSTAIAHFRALYDQTFVAHPWYQRFSTAEMEATLDDPHDILFLGDGDKPIGFAWLRLDDGAGEIEPIGILPAYQGQGNGRWLLITALQTLHKRGARQIKISAWDSNHPALHLYQSLGFQPIQTVTYLARNLQPREK